METFDGRPGKGKLVREVKYRKDRGGRRKENAAMARRRVAARMSLAGRPPRVGFGAKIAVYGGRMGRSVHNRPERVTMWDESQMWRVSAAMRGGRARRRSRVSAYGYLRFAKRRTMEGRVASSTLASRELKTQGVNAMAQGRRRRKRDKSMGMRRGRRSRRRAMGWLNGEGMERRRDRVVRH